MASDESTARTDRPGDAGRAMSPAPPERTGRLVLAAGSMLDIEPLIVLDAAAQAGFDGVGLRLSGVHRIPDPNVVRRRCNDLGIGVFDAEVHRIGEVGPAPEPLLDAAATVGAEAVLVVSDLDDRSATEDRLAAVVEACRERGLRCGIEYMAWTTPSHPAEAITLARSTGAELVVDVLHHHRVGAGADLLAEIVASGVLGWVQVCDAPAEAPAGGVDSLVREARHGRVPPGDGSLPLHDLLAVVPADATITVEVQSDTLAAVGAEERARALFAGARSVLGRG